MPRFLYTTDDSGIVIGSFISGEAENAPLRSNEIKDVNNIIPDKNSLIDSDGLYNYQVVAGVIQLIPRAIKDSILAARVDDLNYVLSPSQVITAKALFNHENRMRALEGKGPITVSQFKTGLLNL